MALFASVGGSFVLSYGHAHQLCLILILILWPPLCWLEQSLALGCVKKFVCVARAVAPLVIALVSLEVVSGLLTLHPPNTNSLSQLFFGTFS
jgi:hypothetical protein